MASNFDIGARPDEMVTVVIPAYNAATSISAAINSARQYVGGEIVVVDDGSTDQTAAIAEEMGTLLIRQRNQGPFAARATGIAAVKTEFSIFLDSDDELLETWTAALKQIIQNPDAVVVGGSVLFIGRRVSRLTRPLQERETTLSLLRRDFAPFPPSAYLWRTESLLASNRSQIPPLNPRFSEDYEMLIRASMHGEVWSVTAPFAKYRVVGGRSVLNASATVADAESIRRYYSGVLGVEVPLLDDLGRRRAAAWRIAMSAYYDRGARSAVTSAMQNPVILPQLVRRVLQRLWLTLRRVNSSKA